MRVGDLGEAVCGDGYFYYLRLSQLPAEHMLLSVQEARTYRDVLIFKDDRVYFQIATVMHTRRGTAIGLGPDKPTLWLSHSTHIGLE